MVLERLLRALSTFISAAESNTEATKLCKVNLFCLEGAEGISRNEGDLDRT